MTARLSILLLALACLSCVTENHTDTGSPAPDRRFEGQLLTIAQSYQSYPLVENSARWAPDLCLPITASSFENQNLFGGKPLAGDLHFSNSNDSQTHGRKLYLLFAKMVKPGHPDFGDADPVYVDDVNPVGQVVVKEAWAPEEVKDDGKPLPSVNRNGKKVIPYARKEGKLYHAREKSALFIMFKMDPRTPDTDEGWVYGTVTPDGKRVTSAGKVESCMKCHQEAPHDRLFGLPADK